MLAAATEIWKSNLCRVHSLNVIELQNAWLLFLLKFSLVLVWRNENVRFHENVNEDDDDDVDAASQTQIQANKAIAICTWLKLFIKWQHEKTVQQRHQSPLFDINSYNANFMKSKNRKYKNKTKQKENRICIRNTIKENQMRERKK